GHGQHDRPDPPAPLGVAVPGAGLQVQRLRVGTDRHTFADGTHAEYPAVRFDTRRSVIITSTKAVPNSSADTAAASGQLNWLTSWKMNPGVVSVLPVRFPDTTTRAPNSPRHRANVSSIPPATAGSSAGNITRRNVVHRPAPRTREASSSAGS